MKLIKTLSFPCETCNETGYVFWGDNNDYDVEPCDCVKENK